MSLATRCTACGTVFRVVQDQLKVSEGWVRCGRCSEVFNATEALFDLERDNAAEPAQATRSASLEALAGSPSPSPSSSPPPSLSPSPSSETPSDFGEIDLDVGSPGASDPLYEPFDPQLAALGPMPAYAPFFESGPNDLHEDDEPPFAREVAKHSTPAARVNERDRLEFPDARFDADVLAGVDDSSVAPGPSPEIADPEATPLPTLEVSEPHFVLHAQRRAHWQSPKMVALQGAALAVLVALLGLQYANHFRDSLAARSPAAASVLAAWCAATSCTLAPPRRIDDLVVESTALTRAPLPDAFKLSVVLRNRGNLAVMPPSVDLSLTDAAGQPVSRRTLTPHDFQASDSALKPGLEAPWQLVLLTAADTNVTGYTVEIFYP